MTVRIGSDLTIVRHAGPLDRWSPRASLGFVLGLSVGFWLGLGLAVLRFL